MGHELTHAFDDQGKYFILLYYSPVTGAAVFTAIICAAENYLIPAARFVFFPTPVLLNWPEFNQNILLSLFLSY